MKKIDKDWLKVPKFPKEDKLFIKAYKGMGLLERKLEGEGRPRKLIYRCLICKHIDGGRTYPSKTREESLRHYRLYHGDLNSFLRMLFRSLNLITKKEDVATYGESLFNGWAFLPYYYDWVKEKDEVSFESLLEKL
jgi:hypothetical protein